MSFLYTHFKGADPIAKRRVFALLGVAALLVAVLLLPTHDCGANGCAACAAQLTFVLAPLAPWATLVPGAILAFAAFARRAAGRPESPVALNVKCNA